MNLKLPNVTIDNHLYLREIKEYDYYDYYIIGSNIKNVKYLTWGPFKNPSEALMVIKEIINKRPLYNLPIGYSIIYDNKMVGIIDYHTYYQDTNSAEVGYILNYDYHNLGIMTKCLNAVVNIGFNYLNYDTIIIGTAKENLASLKVILKNGFKYSFSKEILLNDGLHKAIYYKRQKYD